MISSRLQQAKKVLQTKPSNYDGKSLCSSANLSARNNSGDETKIEEEKCSCESSCSCE